MPLISISPSAAMRTAVPGMGSPTLPIFVCDGRFTVAGAVVSVRP